MHQAAEIRGQNDLRDRILATAVFLSVPYLEGFRSSFGSPAAGLQSAARMSTNGLYVSAHFMTGLDNGYEPNFFFF